MFEILGDIFFKENRFSEAVDTYNRLIDFEPNNKFYYNQIADSYLILENFKEAKIYFDKVLSFNEEDTEILFKLGKISNILKTLKCLPISKIWGIGSKYSRILNSYNIKSAYDFIQLNEEWVLKKMTIMGLRIQNELKGKPCFSIETNPSYKKNICTSRSFDGTVEGLQLIQEAITTHAVRCAEKLRAEKSCARYVSVVLKTNPFDTLGEYYSGYRSMALSIPTNDTLETVSYTHLTLPTNREV